jgi:hypothetical protein
VHRRFAASSWILGVVALGVACASSKTAPSASAVASEAPPPAVSSAPPAGVPAPPPPAGPGVSSIVELDKNKCSPASIDVAQYLSREEIAIGATPTEIAVAYLVQTKDDAKVAFGGFDPTAHRLGRDRSVAGAQPNGLALFPGKDDWIVVWSDPDGFGFSRAKREPELHYETGRFGMMREVPLEDVAIAQSPDGMLAAASPFGTGGGQLTAFKFAATPGTVNQKPIGMTKSATKPHHPVMASDSDGFLLAWVEPDGHMRTVRLDASGALSGGTALLLGPAERKDLALLAYADGFFLVWSEGTTVAAVSLKKDGTLAGAPLKVGEGKWPRAAVSGAQLYVAYVAAEDKLVVAKLSADAGPTSAVRASDVGIRDPAVLAIAGSRVAVFSMEGIPAVATKKAVLHTFETSCVP